jgi:hypothetical protein
VRPETTGPKIQRWQQSIRQGGNVANFAGQTVVTDVATEYFVAYSVDNISVDGAWRRGQAPDSGAISKSAFGIRRTVCNLAAASASIWPVGDIRLQYPKFDQDRQIAFCKPAEL